MLLMCLAGNAAASVTAIVTNAISEPDPTSCTACSSVLPCAVGCVCVCWSMQMRTEVTEVCPDHCFWPVPCWGCFLQALGMCSQAYGLGICSEIEAVLMIRRTTEDMP